MNRSSVRRANTSEDEVDPGDKILSVVMSAHLPGQAARERVFTRSVSAAAEADRNIKLFFDENSPQSVVDLFTNYQPVK